MSFTQFRLTYSPFEPKPVTNRLKTIARELFIIVSFYLVLDEDQLRERELY